VNTPLADIVERLRGRNLLVATVGDPDPADVEVSGLTTDSRLVREGTLFCAVRGVSADGHRFLRGAVESGAVAAIVEEADADLGIPQLVVTDCRKAAAHAAAAFYRDPWLGQTLIGVTGTNGKTTTVAILRHLMSKSRPSASIGTLGLIGPDGLPRPGGEGLTTPGPVQFAETLRALADDGVTAVAMEVSSHALEQERVAAATFSAAIFTNLSRDHLDYHGTLEAYRVAKFKLLDLVRPGGVVATNADDPAWEGVRREGTHLVRFGAEGRGEVQAENIVYRDDGVTWNLLTPSCTSEVRLPLAGTYNVYNALGAAAALWGLGWTADHIAEGMADLGQVQGRLERVPSDGGPQILIDYAHTPDALERALKAIRPLAPGRVIVVFGAGGNRDRGKRPEMGRVAAENADIAIVTTDNPRHEDPDLIIDDIERGMGAASRHRVIDRREAIARAIDLAGPGDVVLLAGKGHETYQIWGDEHRPFDERVIVGEILESRGVGH